MARLGARSFLYHCCDKPRLYALVLQEGKYDHGASQTFVCSTRSLRFTKERWHAFQYLAIVPSCSTRASSFNKTLVANTTS